MSFMRSSDVRSTFASFIEVTLFFCVLSVAYFILCFGLYHVIAQPLAKIRPAEELRLAIDHTRSSATVMVDARREMITMAQSGDENAVRRATRLADQAADDAQTTISDATRLLLADSSQAAGDLADGAAQLVAAAAAMNTAVAEASKATTPPPPEPDADEPTDDQADEQPVEADTDQADTEAVDESADSNEPTDPQTDDSATEETEEAEEPEEVPPPVIVQLGESFGDLVEKVNTLAALSDDFAESANEPRDAIAKIVEAAEEHATKAVRTAAGAIFPDDIDTVAEATLAAAAEIIGQQLDDDDADAITEKTTNAVKTILDEVGRVSTNKIPDMVEAVEDVARTALDDVAGISEEKVRAIAQAAQAALQAAMATADVRATPAAEAGTPTWAEELIERSGKDRLAAEKALTDSLDRTTDAILAVQSAAAAVQAATAETRASLPDAPWSNQANLFIARVDQVESVAQNFLAEADALKAQFANNDEPGEFSLDEQLAALAKVQVLVAAMADDAKARAANPPADVWAGEERVTDLIERIDKALASMLTSHTAAVDNYADPPRPISQDPLPDESPEQTRRRLAQLARHRTKQDAMTYEELSRGLVNGTLPMKIQPRRHLGVLTVQLHGVARQILANCRSARQDIQDDRTQQAKALVDMVWRIEDRVKEVRRRSRIALTVAGAAGRGQVTPGQSKWASISQGLAEVRMGRLFQAKLPPVNFAKLFGSLPWWMWVISGLAYLLILTIYWAPSEDAETNACELRAFSIFAGLVVLSSLIALELGGQRLSRAAGLFIEILQRSG